MLEMANSNDEGKRDKKDESNDLEEEVGGLNRAMRIFLAAIGGALIMASAGVVSVNIVLLKNPIFDLTSLVGTGLGVIIGFAAIYYAATG